MAMTHLPNHTQALSKGGVPSSISVKSGKRKKKVKKFIEEDDGGDPREKKSFKRQKGKGKGKDSK